MVDTTITAYIAAGVVVVVVTGGGGAADGVNVDVGVEEEEG